MNTNIHLRITRVYKYSETRSVFSGVLLNNEHQIKSTKHLIFVDVTTNKLPLEPLRGQHWRILGSIDERKVIRNGLHMIDWNMLDPESLELTLPNDKEHFVSFIAKERDFVGIGVAKADKIWIHFGNSIYEILENEEYDKFQGLINEKLTKTLFKGYKKYSNLKYSYWFSSRRIPPFVSHKIIKYHNEKSIQLIENNPYYLIVFGMKFNQVDALARKSFDIELNDKKRLLAAIEFALFLHSEDGHTVASHLQLKPLVQKLLGSDNLATEALKIGYSKASFKLSPEGYYHSTSLLLMEKVLAKRFLKLVSHGSDWSEEYSKAIEQGMSELNFALTEQQKSAVNMSVSCSISCITGGAGTGKTTVLGTVLRAYDSLGYDIKSMALSGRAAMRMHESTKFLTSTIARFLNEEPLEDGKNIIVIDESSMIDLATMYRIIIHANPHTRILFVGDPEQLPPIGYGLILRDLIKSGVIANTALDIVKRQKGATGIPEYSKQVQQGQVPEKLSTGNVYFHDVDLEDINQTCINLYAKAPLKSQIIGSTYDPKFGGINELNKGCQKQINTNGERLWVNPYGELQYLNIKQGDPILFVKNNYKEGVQNGTLGKLISVEQTDNSYGVVKIDKGEEIKLSIELLNSIKPGYAISLHKAQGSQFYRVIVPINEVQMLDQNWIYTAITRAEHELHIVGPEQLFKAAIRRKGATSKRMTYLSELLCGCK